MVCGGRASSQKAVSSREWGWHPFGESWLCSEICKTENPNDYLVRSSGDPWNCQVGCGGALLCWPPQVTPPCSSGWGVREQPGWESIEARCSQVCANDKMQKNSDGGRWLGSILSQVLLLARKMLMLLFPLPSPQQHQPARSAFSEVLLISVAPSAGRFPAPAP